VLVVPNHVRNPTKTARVVVAAAAGRADVDVVAIATKRCPRRRAKPISLTSIGNSTRTMT
jgi:hypothetical protein